MARLFWIKCPNCGGKFYAQIVDFRGQERDLSCPFCSHRFKDHEARMTWEQGPPPSGWHLKE